MELPKTPRYWFSKKKIGWGLSPATWQGWLSVVTILVLNIGSLYLIIRYRNFILDLVCLLLLLVSGKGIRRLIKKNGEPL